MITARYNVYFYGFILCEFLNVLVATSVLFLTNKFLNHRFLLYGLKVGKANTSWRVKLNCSSPQVSSYYRLPEEEQRLQKNPMCEVFPRIGGQDWRQEWNGLC